MSKILKVILVIFLFLVSIFIFLSFKGKSIEKNKVSVTIFPFYDITKEIVGEKMEVTLIVPPGAEPHNFELTPLDILKIKESKVIFTSGTNIDLWINNITRIYHNVKVINLNQDLPLIIEKQKEVDPHFWLSIENMKKISEIISKEIISIDPENKSYYEENLKKVKTKLENLKNKAEKEMKNLKSRYIITQHNAFEYLAKELNLQILAYLESENKELTLKDLKDVIDKIRAYNIKVVFKEPKEKEDLIKILESKYKLKIYDLDPLEGKGAQNFFEGYENNIKILKEVLK